MSDRFYSFNMKENLQQMVKNIMRDPLFLSQKSEAATKEDLQIGGDLMDTLVRNSYMGSFSGNDVYWEKPFFDYEV